MEMEEETGSSRVVGPAKVIAGLTLVSRGLGLIRDAVCAHVLGVGAASSAFWVAFQIPNLFRRLFGEGALSAAFIPVFSDYHHAGDRAGARRVGCCVLGLLVVTLLGLTLLGEATLGLLGKVGWDTERTRLTLSLTALMLPFMVMICVTAMLGGLLNVLGHFATPASAPIVLNVCMIAAAIGAGVWRGLPANQLVFVVAASVLVAGIVQVVIHWIAVERRGYRLTPAFDTRHEGVRRIIRTMGPMVVGLGAVQINTLADTLIAYWYIPFDGAPTVLYYAQRLYDFPLGVFSLAVVTAVFPELSRLATLNDTARYGATVIKGLRLVLFIGLPASIGLILVREPLVAFLFERGEFGAEGTRRVAQTLIYYAAGVWAYGCQHVLIRSFYALKDSRTPMRIAAYMILLNVPLNLILVWPLAEGGLALSTAICAVIQVIWLGRTLARRMGEVSWWAIESSVLRTAVATLAMTIMIVLLDAMWLGDVHVGARLAALVASGVVVFVAVAAALKHPELRELARGR